MSMYESIIEQINIERLIIDKSHDALEKIRDIINNESLSDPECFQQIDEIIFILEKIGVICDKRHLD